MSPRTLSREQIGPIPAELRERHQWVVWRLEVRKDKKGNGKDTKVPYSARTWRPASSTDPATWASFDDALASHEAADTSDGVGFVFTANDPYVGVDLDHCFGDDGRLAGWATMILGHFPGAYIERSPSGHGLKLFVRGAWPRTRHRKPLPAGNGARVEVYDRARYFTVTGDVWGTAPHELPDATEGLVWLASSLFPEPKPAPKSSHPSANGSPSVDDEELIDKAHRATNGALFAQLWAGEWDAQYDSQSEADLALCSMLAFYAGPDPERVDRLFRRSGLCREKWERADYRKDTINKAIAGRTQFYSAHTAGGQPESQPAERPTIIIEPYAALDLDGEAEPIRWILEGWIPDRAITLVCGGAGEGKSTLLGAQALAIAAGVAPWRHGVAPAEVRPVVYLDAEMGENATRRMFRRLRVGLGLERTPAGLIVCSDPGGISLLTEEGRQRIEATIDAAAQRHGAAPVLMLDTLSAVLAGLQSFNDAALVEPIYAHMFRWRDRLGATIKLGHHPRKRSKGESAHPTLDMVRDSSTHVGKCSDVLFGRKPTPDAPYLDIYTLKGRGRDPVPVQRIGYQSDGHGQPIVLSLLEAPQPADDALVLRAQELVASFLRENGGTGKRAAIVERLDSLGVKERTVDRALKSLLSLGALSKPRQGTYSIRFQTTMLVEDSE